MFCPQAIFIHQQTLPSNKTHRQSAKCIYRNWVWEEYKKDQQNVVWQCGEFAERRSVRTKRGSPQHHHGHWTTFLTHFFLSIREITFIFPSTLFLRCSTIDIRAHYIGMLVNLLLFCKIKFFLQFIFFLQLLSPAI